MTKITFRKALDIDLERIETLLQESNLPHDDCKYHLNNFLLMEQDGDIIGLAGAELYGPIALLRSLAVAKKYRGKGIGNSLFFKIGEELIAHGVEKVYLLTETAQDYFKERGFSQISRDAVPPEIKQTEQFSALCPSSATLMTCPIQSIRAAMPGIAIEKTH